MTISTIPRSFCTRSYHVIPPWRFCTRRSLPDPRIFSSRFLHLSSRNPIVSAWNLMSRTFGLGSRPPTCSRSAPHCFVTATLLPGDPVVSTSWLSDRLNDVCILDIRGRVETKMLEYGVQKSEYIECYNDYLEGHIPGSVFVNWLKDGVDFDSHVPVQLIVDNEQFAAVMERKGVSTEKPVVVYDCGDGLLAPRLWWALVMHGHPSVYVLDGGWKKWIEEGRDVELYEPCPLKIYAIFEPSKIKDSAVISAKELLLLISNSNIEMSKRQEDLKIIDARSQEQFKGHVRRSKHGGRIPGAINIPRQQLLEASGRFKSIEEQREVFLAAGLSPHRPTDLIAYCNGGVASCTILLAWIRIGGQGIWANYDGSWNEWGNRDDLPIEI